MIDLKPISKLKALPVAGLKKVRDLVEHDGPFLSHFTNARNDQFLYYWCDCDENVNRWMLLRVDETSLVRLVNGFVPLDYVIPTRCRDDFVYFVDIDGKGTIKQVLICLTSSIPEQYTPGQGSYLDVDTCANDRSFTLLIEKALNPTELVHLPSKYFQAYSMLYTASVMRPKEFAVEYPWRGGYSSMHFYKELMGHLPGEQQPELDAIQYASPGFVRFKLHRPTAIAVSRCVKLFEKPKSPANVAYQELKHYITEHKLNDQRKDNTDLSSPEWKKHDADLLSKTKKLLDAMEFAGSDTINKAAHSRFEAAKIAISFATRLRELASYDKDGRVRFPKQ